MTPEQQKDFNNDVKKVLEARFGKDLKPAPMPNTWWCNKYTKWVNINVMLVICVVCFFSDADRYEPWMVHTYLIVMGIYACMMFSDTVFPNERKPLFGLYEEALPKSKWGRAVYGVVGVLYIFSFLVYADNNYMSGIVAWLLIALGGANTRAEDWRMYETLEKLMSTS